MWSIFDILHKNFQEDQLNSRRFPGFPGGFLNSRRFPGFPGVVDTLKLSSRVKETRPRSRASASMTASTGGGSTAFIMNWPIGPSLSSLIDKHNSCSGVRNISGVVCCSSLTTTCTATLLNKMSEHDQSHGLEHSHKFTTLMESFEQCLTTQPQPTLRDNNAVLHHWDVNMSLFTDECEYRPQWRLTWQSPSSPCN